MKRELKAGLPHCEQCRRMEIARPIPMKRELKEYQAWLLLSSHTRDRKAHPDEKGTESLLHCPVLADGLPRIARPIPMKRELKDQYSERLQFLIEDRKAHPDEKGTESAAGHR